VSYDSFASTATSAAEQLRERIARASKAKRAAADLDQLAQQQDITRKKALEAVEQSVKTRLLELLAMRFPVKSYCSGPSDMFLAVELDGRNTVSTCTTVIWDDASNPLVGQVSLRGALNQAAETAGLRTLSIGEIDAGAAGLTALCESLFEAVCALLVRAQDLVDVDARRSIVGCDLAPPQQS